MAKKTRKKSVSGKGGGAKSLLNPANPMLQLASAGLGYFVLADPINDGIDKLFSKMTKPPDDKIIGGAMAGAGGYYLFIKKGKKNLLLTVGSGVVAGAGAKRLLKSLGIGGFYDVKPVSGFYDVKAVSAAHRRNGVHGPFTGEGALNMRSGMGMHSMIDSSLLRTAV